MADYDLVILGDFRFPGGTSAAVAAELRALAGSGFRVAVQDWRAPMPWRGWQTMPRNPALARAIAETGTTELLPGDAASTTILALHNPMIFEQALPPTTVRPETMMVISHQVPASVSGEFYYDPWDIDRRMSAAFGLQPVWAPIAPVGRRILAETGFSGHVLAEDWTNTLDVAAWRSDLPRPLGPRPVIGRHGRPQPDKWPEDPDVLRQAYAAGDPKIRVRLLGVQDWLRGRLGGEWPANWQVYPFGAMPAADFLREIDFFVYYHAQDLVEAFGRTVIEAAASGAVAILPAHFEETFGEIALYRTPDEVHETVTALHADPMRFRDQVERARHLTAARFGPEALRARLDRVLHQIRSEGRPRVASVPTTAALAAEPLNRVRAREARKKRALKLRMFEIGLTFDRFGLRGVRSRVRTGLRHLGVVR